MLAALNVLSLLIAFFCAAEKRVIPGSADGQFEFGSFMSATLSCDHRVIDGKLSVFVRCLHGLWTRN